MKFSLKKVFMLLLLETERHVPFTNQPLDRSRISVENFAQVSQRLLPRGPSQKACDKIRRDHDMCSALPTTHCDEQAAFAVLHET